MANNTTITGNLTREPEIRYTKEGQATAQLGVAVNRRWQDRATQEWQEATSFFDVVCWRDLAENVALSLSKGMRVVVTARRSRSPPTRSGRASASPPPMCSARSGARFLTCPRPTPWAK
jgi:single-stranded DNA-binding protein